MSATAKPIATNANGLSAGMQRVPARDAVLPAYVARPKGIGKRPVVIVVPEVWGLHEYIRDVCRRLAKEGYVAIAPDFFARAGDPAPLTEWSEIAKIVGTATHAQVMADVGATLSMIARGEVRSADPGRIAITGFCWGGLVTWMACAEFAQLRAGVAWYGRLAKPPAPNALFTDNRPFPVDVASQLKAPVLGLYAENDQSIPLNDVERMRAALAAANKTGSSIHVYPGTQHGFHADYREIYDEAAAKDGWMRMKRHFAENGLTP
ncbi:MAG TPA: dienelactone hydrolase family protein [Dongiaceae bacterium]|nr:dienelactone hydrolase family protein [Dongiaceae bacterium]